MKMRSAYLGYKETIAMPDHESAQCKILVDYDGNICLLSYNTIVCKVNTDGWFYINGLYSRTTIKHIGWFMRYISAHFSTSVSYYDAKRCYEHDLIMNVKSKEAVTYEDFNEKQYAEMRTA